MSVTVSSNIVAADHDFKIYKGDTWVNKLTFTDSQSNPVNFSGAVVKLQIKRDPVSDVIELELDLSDGITISGASFNEINLSKIVDLAAGTYTYDLEVTKNSVVTTYLKGKIIITQDVTRIP